LNKNLATISLLISLYRTLEKVQGVARNFKVVKTLMPIISKKPPVFAEFVANMQNILG